MFIQSNFYKHPALKFIAVRISEVPTDLLQTFCSRKVHKCTRAELCAVAMASYSVLIRFRYLSGDTVVGYEQRVVCCPPLTKQKHYSSQSVYTIL